jgi:hypothetical protein
MKVGKLIAAMLALIAPAIPTLAAASKDITVDLTPASVQLGAGYPSRALLITRNNTSSPLLNVRIHWFTDLNLTVTPEGAASPIIKAHSVSVWPVTISQSTPGRSVGKLNFWTTWDTADSSSAGAAVASLDIAEKAELSADKLVTLKIESAIDQFDERHPTNLYLVATNTSSIPVTVKKVHADSPGFITLTSSPAGDTVIPPSGSQTFVIVAKTDGTGPPGNQRVILDADLNWIDLGKPQALTISVAQTLPLSVLGESDLLKLIGVPSFLFLPGFLAMAIFSAIWSRTKEAGYPELKLTLAETAVAAVTLSIAAAVVYPLFPPHRDYLSGYGLRDVFWVWVGSIVLGVLAWAILFAVYNLRRRIAERRSAQKAALLAAENEARLREITPTKTDTPLDILARMQLIHLQPPPKQTLVSLAGAPKVRAFLLVPNDLVGAPPDSPSWVAPPISLSPTAQVDAAWSRASLIYKLKQDGIFKDYRSLATLLTEAQSAGWKVEWGESGAIISPTPVRPNALEDVPYAQGFNFIRI